MSRASMRSSARSHSSLRRRGTCYREFGYTLADFAGNTSAHGIPRAYNSRGRLRRFLWLLLFLCCFVAFSGQAYQIVKRFFRNDIIVGVELKFENIPFPSVTVCNLNPYKNSLAREMVSVGDTLLAYDSAMAAFHSHSHQQHQQPSRLHKREANGTTTNNNNGGRRRWLSRFEGLLAVFAFCQCQPDSLMGCQALKDVDQAANGAARAPLCLCFYNPQNEQVWPCFEPAQWLESQCRGCSSLGNCAFEQSTGWNGGRNGNNNSSSNGKAQQNKTAAGIGHGQQPSWPCLCAPAIRICVRVDDQPGKGNRNGNGNRTSNSSGSTSADAPPLMERVPKIWELKRVEMLLGDETEEQREAKQEAYGLRGVNDPIAIRAKAVENLVFAVNSLTELEKRRMGYGKQEFITKCSFNGRQCSVEDDFSLYVDPTFGNCFTFNAHSESNVRSERAGPNYGLRFQVFVNVSDYLPTTEAAGVRITVHSPEDQPFPDTHGHSAPTGFVSSFGIRLKRVNRLPAPYGDCVEHGKTAEYIFRDKDYSTEGCQRSCIQRLFVRRCGCGDPRFPRYMNYTNCPVGDPKLRACLRRELKSAARSATQPDCVCRQPCREQVYSITYSCARWPSSDLALQGSGDCDPELSGGQCLQFHREQSAIVEVYFEQLNYESLQESEAYGLPNLLSDFGGQLGLWMGVSVITIMEVGLLFSELLIRFALFPCANALRQVFESGSEEELAAATVAPGGGRVVAEQQMRKSRRVLAHKGSFIQWIDADELEEEEKPSRYGPHINEVEKCEKEEESNDGAAKYYSIEDDQ